MKAAEEFFARRLNGTFSRAELCDVTNRTFDDAAAILRCTRCGVLLREESPDDDPFREDRYRDAVMQRLHETHVRAFREKEADYRALVPSPARVVEVASYAGGFLATAADWGWSAIGCDVARDPVRFCRSLGLDVRWGAIQDCGFESDSFDAVFVWNCFEQLESTRELLAESHRILRNGGLFVIRIPDAAFYIRCHQPFALELLAYNGLLGWPHRFGYDSATVRRIAEQHGFEPVCELRRAVIRPLREAMHEWARSEEEALLSEGNYGWIELLFRRP